MLSEKMGRRKFIKTLSSTFLGIAAPNILKVRSSLGKGEKTSTLEYRALGRSGLKVTAVSMGVMNCSDPAVVDRAFDLGINFYDTAPSYVRGTNEEMVGTVLKGKREKVFIQTKVQVHEERQMQASVERSLRRLKTDYIDFLVWHGLRSPDEITNPQLYEFMAKMKKQGKARFTGFSAHSNMATLLREAAKSPYHDVALVSYNFTHSKNLRDAVALAAQKGIGIVAMKTQAGGYKKERMEGLTPHQAALKYVLMDRNVSAAIPGVTTIEQIEECAAVMGASFTKGELNMLRKYQSFLQGRICTMCGGCIGECPYGVSHQDLLRLVMYHDGYENDSLAEESLRSISRQDFQHCSECSSCSIVCRRGLDIKAQMNFVRNLFV